MMVRMNGEEVSIEGRAGKANETNAIGTRGADLSPNQNEEENLCEIMRTELCKQEMNEKREKRPSE